MLASEAASHSSKQRPASSIAPPPSPSPHNCIPSSFRKKTLVWRNPTSYHPNNSQGCHISPNISCSMASHSICNPDPRSNPNSQLKSLNNQYLDPTTGLDINSTNNYSPASPSHKPNLCKRTPKPAINLTHWMVLRLAWETLPIPCITPAPWALALYAEVVPHIN